MEKGGLLALDLARVLGWCYWSPTAIDNWPRSPLEFNAARGRGWDPAGIEYGSVTIAPTGIPYGKVAVAYQAWIGGIFTKCQPRHSVRESPIVNIGWNDKSSIKRHSLDQDHRGWTFHVVTFLMAEHHGIVDHHADVNTARKFTAGTKKVSKEDVHQIFRDRGLAPQSLDVSDAMCIGDYAIEKLYPIFRPAPLRAASSPARLTKESGHL